MWPACAGLLYWCHLLTCEKRGGKFSIPCPVKAFLRCGWCSTQVHSGRECSAGRFCKSLPAAAAAAASWGRRGSGVLRLWKNSLRAVFPGRWCPKTPERGLWSCRIPEISLYAPFSALLYSGKGEDEVHGNCKLFSSLIPTHPFNYCLCFTLLCT